MYIKEKWEYRNGELFFRVISYYESEEAYNNGDAPIKIEENPEESVLTLAQLQSLMMNASGNIVRIEKAGGDYDRS